MHKRYRLFIALVTLLSTFYTFGQITYAPAFPNINFEYPLEIETPNDGTDRLFIVEQKGKIKVLPNNPTVNPVDVNTFLDIRGEVGGPVKYEVGQEMGLLSIAFHPNYSSNGYFYALYTADSPISGIRVRVVLSRFSVDPN